MEYYGIIICPFCKEISKMSLVMSDWWRTERISLILEFLNIQSLVLLFTCYDFDLFLSYLSKILLILTFINIYFYSILLL